MKLIHYLLISLFMPIGGGLCYAQDIHKVTFVSSVSKTALALNEDLRIEFTINRDSGENFTPPEFKNFEIIHGQKQSVSNTWIDEKKSASKTYKYTLKPSTMGLLYIGEANIEIDNVIYKTDSVAITVSKARDLLEIKKEREAQHQKQQKEKIVKSVHVVTEVSKNSLILKDSLIATHRIYVSPSIEIFNWEMAKAPVYKNCTVKAYKTKKSEIETVKFNGENYRTVIFKQTIVKPKKTGEIIINPVVIDFVVNVPSNRKDIFGSTLYQSKSITLKSNTVTVNVSK